MHQRWEHLLFLHWETDPEAIQATLPPGLFVDTHEGKAYVGIVPFFMRGVRPSFLPPVPGISHFLELNLRTYVYDQHGRPGVWFYSLDANQWLAVKIARSLFALPYVRARMNGLVTPAGMVDFRSRRKGADVQRFVYRRGEALGTAQPGSLAYFLVERYLLFSYRPRSRSLYVGKVHHPPYEIHRARVLRHDTALFSLNGFTEPADPFVHALVAPGVRVRIFAMQAL